MQMKNAYEDAQLYADMLTLLDNLKNVSMSRFYLIEKNKKQFYSHLDAMRGFFNVITSVRSDNPLVFPKSGSACYVIVTSDSGFMGGLNNRVMSAYRNIPQAEGSKELPIVIGEKGANQLKDIGLDYVFFQGIKEEEKELVSRAHKITDYIVSECLKGAIGRVEVIYPSSTSFYQQEIKRKVVLPFEFLKDNDYIPDDRKPIFESDYGSFVKTFAECWLLHQFYDIFKDSKLSEYSARVVHLEGSNTNIEKLLKNAKMILKEMYKKKNESQILQANSVKILKRRRLKRKARHLAELSSRD